MECLVEDCVVFTPDDYMYIDDYEHPVDYIHRIYFETIRRIHLMELEKKRHVEREEDDVQIYPYTCVCCRNHHGKPDEIEIARKLRKKPGSQHVTIANNKSKNQTQFNTTESNVTKSITSNSGITISNPIKLNSTKSDTTGCITTKLNTIKIKSTKSNQKN